MWSFSPLDALVPVVLGVPGFTLIMCLTGPDPRRSLTTLSICATLGGFAGYCFGLAYQAPCSSFFICAPTWWVTLPLGVFLGSLAALGADLRRRGARRT